LGTEDFEVAKTRLLEWYYENHKQRATFANPSTVPLAEVLLDYWNHHGSKLVSAKTVKILLRDWNEFWGDASVGDVRDINRQEEFHEFLAKRGLSPNSINRVVEIGRAAIRRAWKRGVIDSAPYVQTVKANFDLPMGEPLSIAQLRAFYRGSDEQHWQDFFLLMLGTGGRTGAAVKLKKDQLDFAEGLIYLNPKGRRQTSKFRATVRLLPTLRERFQNRPDGPLVVFHGKAVGKVSHVMRIARNRAGLAPVKRGKEGVRINSYSIRHTVARYLRQQGVDTAEIACQIGHKRFGYDMTLRYMPNAPDYLVKSAAALEKLLQEVLAPAARQKSEKAA
jgi:integrase